MEKTKSMQNFFVYNLFMYPENITRTEYTRLKSNLLSIINHSDESNSEFRIAHYLLKQSSDNSKISIQDIAEKCYVSKATVSRFCRSIGYEDFYELRLAMYDMYLFSKTGKYKQYVKEDRYISLYFSQMEKMIADTQNSIRKEDLEALADLIHAYDQVGIIGVLQSGSTASNMQYNLQSAGKTVLAPDSIEDQKIFLDSAGNNTLVLLISASGRSLEYYQTKTPNAYMCLITNTETDDPRYQKTFMINCDNNFAARPQSLEIFCSLVCLCYASKYSVIENKDK